MSRVAFRRVALLLVLGDVFVVLLHLAEVRVGPLGPDWFPSARLRINQDRGLAETWGYVQTGLAAVLLVAVSRRVHEPLSLAWAGVLFLVLLDDAFFLHERMGEWAAETWDLPVTGGLREIDIGELGAWALMGVLALTALLLAARATGQQERRASLPLFAAFLALIFFAVVLDMVHQAVGAGGARLLGVELDPALRFVEALGELLAMTGILLTVLLRVRRLPSPADRGTARDVGRRP